MRTLYLECNMGAAGDMLLAALLELHPQPQKIIEKLNRLGLPGVWLKAEKVKKCGIGGTHVEVTVNGEVEVSEEAEKTYMNLNPEHLHTHAYMHTHALESCQTVSNEQSYNENYEQSHAESGAHLDDHTDASSHAHGNVHTDASSHAHGNVHTDASNHAHGKSHTDASIHPHGHTSLREIENLISGFALPETVREHAKAVYRLLAEAEAKVHQQEISQIHFHEVGTMDAVMDVTGVCLLLHELQIERVIASPVHVGSGQVRCAHGILPVPAPATAQLLMGVPIYSGEVKGELCTPTGAALLKYFVESFGKMPPMRVEKIGYGMGKKDFAQANCVRALLGETEAEGDQISELVCNLDDMTPEEIGFAVELLMQEGALDVYTTSIQMKKNRPGVMLTCICKTEEKERFLSLIFRHTTTLGVREYECRRYKLTRRMREEDTPYGTVRVKKGSGYGTEREKLEYEDLARIAREQNLSLREVKEIIRNR